MTHVEKFLSFACLDKIKIDKFLGKFPLNLGVFYSSLIFIIIWMIIMIVDLSIVFSILNMLLLLAVMAGIKMEISAKFMLPLAYLVFLGKKCIVKFFY